MQFKALVLAAAAIPAAFVVAQSSSAAAPTSTSALSPCVLTCITQALTSAGCNGITDIQCLCTSSTFQNDAASCLQSNCSSADLQAGQALQQQTCATVSGASTVSITATGSASETSSASGGAASSVSSAASSISSRASSALSSISSAISSRTSAAGSILSSATNAASSAANSAANSSSAAGYKAPIAGGALAGTLVVGVLGVIAGVLLV